MSFLFFFMFHRFVLIKNSLPIFSYREAVIH